MVLGFFHLAYLENNILLVNEQKNQQKLNKGRLPYFFHNGFLNDYLKYNVSSF